MVQGTCHEKYSRYEAHLQRVVKYLETQFFYSIEKFLQNRKKGLRNPI